MTDSEQIKERVFQFIKALGSNPNKFQESIGVSGTYLKTVNSLGSDKISAIAKRYPNLNIEWLVTGEGDMFKSKNQTTRQKFKGDVAEGVVAGSIAGNVDNRHKTTNYNGLTIEEAIVMLEERFQHLLKKDADIETIFEENRKLTNEVIKQNKELREYNAIYREMVERLTKLLDKE